MELLNCGTLDTKRACLTFDLLPKNEEKKSSIIGCSIHDGRAMGLVVKNSHYITAKHNIFHGLWQTGANFIFANNFEFSHNFISDVYNRPKLNIVYVHVAGVDFTNMPDPSK